MKLKLLAASIFVLGYLFIVFPANAQMQNTNYMNTNSDVPQNLHTYTQSVFIEIAATISCQLSGFDPTNPNGKCLGIDPVTNKIGFVEGGGGAIGVMGNLIAGTFQIPINTHDYGAYLAGNFGITKPAYAQEGIGFNGLLPTLNLWKAFRNLTYMIFVILFVIVGLGIMFRIKIDPRTVMAIQNQIPKIIIAIVLVTFSYSIAGFLVDLMYVTMYLAITVFAQEGVTPVNLGASEPFSAVGGIGGISGIASGTAHSLGHIIASIFDGTLGTIIGAIVGAIIGKFIGSGVGTFLGPVGHVVAGPIGGLVGLAGGALFGNKIVGLMAGVIAYLVIVIALFSALLRLWFVLIKSYIFVLITVVFAPFYIAYGLIPGKSGFGNWIKSMLANLAVFPVTIIMILLGKAFIDGFTKGNAGNPPFIPPMVGDWASPDRFASIIGLGFILMLPEVSNMVREALKAPEFKFAGAIGKSLAVGAGVAGALPKNVGGAFFGEDRMGNPRAGTRFIQQRFGGLLGTFAGGHIPPAGSPHAVSLLPPPIQKGASAVRRGLGRFIRRRTTAPGTAAAMARGSGVGTAAPAGTGPTARAARTAAGTPPAGTNPLPPGTPPVPPAPNTWPSGRPRTGGAAMTEIELEDELTRLRAIPPGTGDPQQIRERIDDLEFRLRQRRGNP